MKRFAMTNSLKDDAEAIRMYDHYHLDVWPEVLEDNRRAGIRRLYIFRSGTRLFMFCESEGVDPTNLEGLAGSPRSREFQELMKSLFEPSSEGSGSAGWTLMSEVTAFETPSDDDTPNASRT
jgi:L-rhamnose mutarotase